MPTYGKIVVIKRTGADGATFPLTITSCLIGRDSDCDIRIQLPSVSLQHCSIDVNADTHQVSILNRCHENPVSVNGVAVNDSIQLHHADVFTVADRSFRFEYPDGSTFFRSPKKSISPKVSLKVKSPKKSNARRSLGSKTETPKANVAVYSASQTASIPANLDSHVKILSLKDNPSMVSQSNAMSNGSAPSTSQPAPPVKVATPMSAIFSATAKPKATTLNVARTPSGVKGTGTPRAVKTPKSASHVDLLPRKVLLKKHQNKELLTPLRVVKTPAKILSPRKVPSHGARTPDSGAAFKATPRSKSATNIKQGGRPLPEDAAGWKEAIESQLASKVIPGYNLWSGQLPPATTGTPTNSGRAKILGKPATPKSTSATTPTTSAIKQQSKKLLTTGRKTPTDSAQKASPRTSPRTGHMSTPKNLTPAQTTPKSNTKLESRRSPNSTPRQGSKSSLKSGQRRSPNNLPPKSIRKASPQTANNLSTPARKITRTSPKSETVSSSKTSSPLHKGSPKRNSLKRTHKTPSSLSHTSPRNVLMNTRTKSTSQSTHNATTAVSPLTPKSPVKKAGNSPVVSPAPDVISPTPKSSRVMRDASPKSPISPKTLSRKSTDDGSSESSSVFVDPEFYGSLGSLTSGGRRVSITKRNSQKLPPVSPRTPVRKPRLRKSIDDLKRRSVIVPEVADTPASIGDGAKKRKSSESLTPVQMVKRKRVSFGPNLSPEQFDVNLPPTTPIRRGKLPPVSNGTPYSLKRSQLLVSKTIIEESPLSPRQVAASAKKSPQKSPSPATGRSGRLSSSPKGGSVSPSRNSSLKTEARKSSTSPIGARRSTSPTLSPKNAASLPDVTAKKRKSSVSRSSANVQNSSPIDQAVRTAKSASKRGRPKSLSRVSETNDPHGSSRRHKSLSPAPKQSTSAIASPITILLAKDKTHGPIEVWSNKPSQSRKKNASSAIKNPIDSIFLGKKSQQTTPARSPRHLEKRSKELESEVPSPITLLEAKRNSSHRIPVTPSLSSTHLRKTTTPDGGSFITSPVRAAAQKVAEPGVEISPIGVHRVMKTPKRKSRASAIENELNLAGLTTPDSRNPVPQSSTPKSSSMLSLGRSPVEVIDVPLNADGNSKKHKSSSDLPVDHRDYTVHIRSPAAERGTSSLSSPSNQISGGDDAVVANERVQPPPSKRSRKSTSLVPASASAKKTPKSARNTSRARRDTPRKSRTPLPKPLLWSHIVKMSKAPDIQKVKTPKRKSAVPSRKPAIRSTKKVFPKTPRARARALAPSTGHATSPETIVIQKKAVNTPKPLPRKGRKSLLMGRKQTVDNTSFTGFSDLLRTPDVASPKTHISDVSMNSLYGDLPVSPEGPGTMVLSPLVNTERVQKRRAGLTQVRLNVLMSDQKPIIPDAGRKTVAKSPALSGMRTLFHESSAPSSPQLSGVREMLMTPKTNPVSPDLRGVREMMRSPARSSKSPELGGLKQLVATPRVNKSPRLAGLRRLVKSPSPPSSSPDLRGVREMMRSPTGLSTSPELGGLKQLVATPRVNKSPRLAGLRRLVKSPSPPSSSPDLRGLRDLMRSPRLAGGIGDSDLSGLGDMFASPLLSELPAKSSRKSSLKKPSPGISSPAHHTRHGKVVHFATDVVAVSAIELPRTRRSRSAAARGERLTEVTESASPIRRGRKSAVVDVVESENVASSRSDLMAIKTSPKVQPRATRNAARINKFDVVEARVVAPAAKTRGVKRKAEEVPDAPVKAAKKSPTAKSPVRTRGRPKAQPPVVPSPKKEVTVRVTSRSRKVAEVPVSPAKSPVSAAMKSEVTVVAKSEMTPRATRTRVTNRVTKSPAPKSVAAKSPGSGRRASTPRASPAVPRRRGRPPTAKLTEAKVTPKSQRTPIKRSRQTSKKLVPTLGETAAAIVISPGPARARLTRGLSRPAKTGDKRQKTPVKKPSVRGRRSDSPSRVTTSAKKTRNAKQAAKKTPVKAARKTPVKAARKTPVKAARKTPVKAARKTPVKAARKTPVKAARKTPVKAALKPKATAAPRKTAKSPAVSPPTARVTRSRR